MRLAAFLLLMVAFCTIGYIGGVGPIISLKADSTSNETFIQAYGTSSNDVMANGTLKGQSGLSGYLSNQDAAGDLLALGIGTGIAVAVAIFTGFSAMYLIPLIILVFILHFFVFPFGYILDPSMPDMLRTTFYLFFNTIQTLALITFIRGGSR